MAADTADVFYAVIESAATYRPQRGGERIDAGRAARQLYQRLQQLPAECCSVPAGLRSPRR